MASGVKVTEEVVKCYKDMKLHRTNTKKEEKQMRKKFAMFCLSEDLKTIIVEEGKEILTSDLGTTVSDPIEHLLTLLPKDDCRYGLYDASYETSDTKKEDLVFMFWAPDTASIKSKMIYASSKNVLKNLFKGIKHEWQLNTIEDIKDRDALAEKLGNCVTSLEGKRVLQ